MFEIFEYDFMIKALIAGSLLGVLAPLVGQFMVVRRLSGFGDAISHISLLGFSVGLLAGSFSVYWAILISIIGSLILEFLRERFKLFRESLLILITVFSLSLVSIFRQTGLIKIPLEQFLFGNILSISWLEIWTLLGVLILTLILIIKFFDQLFSLCLDEDLAFSEGVKVSKINILLMVLISVAVSLGIPLFGGLLMTGVLVIPVLTTFNFKLSFKNSLFLATLISILGIILGIILAWVFNLPVSAMIILVLISEFILSLLFREK